MQHFHTLHMECIKIDIEDELSSFPFGLKTDCDSFNYSDKELVSFFVSSFLPFSEANGFLKP